MSQVIYVADYEVRVEGKLESVPECILKTAGVARQCSGFAKQQQHKQQYNT